MDDRRFGTTIRTIRQRKKWRQEDLAERADVSPSLVSRIERGQFGEIPLDRIRAVAGALGVQTQLTAWWRGGDLDLLLNRRHSLLHEAVARYIRERAPEWMLAPEVSFSIWGERGVIDILAWHPGRRALLIIELKTDVVDVNDLLGRVDRKRRLGREVAAQHGWDPETVSVWIIVADGRTNRRRVAAHSTMLRSAFPADGRAMPGWLRAPNRAIAGLTFWRVAERGSATGDHHPVRRVRRVGRGEAGGSNPRTSAPQAARFLPGDS
jgi:transcriptional regulator with XRE-family HTH domain